MYVNKNKSTYSHCSKHARIWRQQCILFFFLFCYLSVLFLRDSTLMFIYHRHLCVLYIIHQNNPVSKSLCCIIPWFLHNRSYHRRAPGYRRHPMKLPSSVISDKLAYRRLAAILSVIIVLKKRKGTSLSLWCKVCHASVFLCSKFERDRWSQRGSSRQKLLEASGRVGAILTTVASRGCPQWEAYCITWKLSHHF